MLTPQERLNATKVLNLLTEEDLISLALTVSNGDLKPVDKEEAIKIVTRHEEGLLSFFSRKKITKPILAKYLFSEGVSYPGASDKSSLVAIIIEQWKKIGSQKPERPPVESPTMAAEEKKDSGEVGVAQNRVRELALQFSQWFYTMLNQEFKPTGSAPLSGSVFWGDARVSVRLRSADGSQEVEENSEGGGPGCADLLRRTVRDHGLFFSPNLDSGIRGVLEPHGIVLVAACGTLHSGAGQLVGCFEQAFTLVRDPLAEDMWRIKMSEVRLTAQPALPTSPSLSSSSQPSLPSSSS